MAICTANMPNAHASLQGYLLSDSLERKAAKDGISMVAAVAAVVIG